MEAPEKIYLYPSDRAGEEYEDEWGTMPWGEDCIEYTRTDAFIEKACEWLNNFYSEDRHSYLVAEDIKAFKKAMEEEENERI